MLNSYVACDFPEANRLTVHILAAVAELEAAMICARTKGRSGGCQGARHGAGWAKRGSLELLASMAAKGTRVQNY
jgi:hypothetical protein